MCNVLERIRKELDGPGCMGGYRSIWLRLKMDGFQVPRHHVGEFVRQLDPEGSELRRTKSLKRRKYKFTRSQSLLAAENVRVEKSCG